MATESVKSGEAALQFREKLQAFGRLAAAAMDELMTLAMAGGGAAQDAAAGGILERYGELVQQIGQLAWDSGLAGLQAVCSLVETNVLLLRGETRPLTGDECALLEGWPMLLFAYMANHADRESSTALLQSLSATWPMTLPADAAVQELDRLMGVQQPSADSAPDSGAVMLHDGEPQQVEREVLAILASELELMAAEFATEGADAGRGTPGGRQEVLDHYCDFLGRLKLAAESVGLSTLGALFAALRQQVAPLTEGLSAEQQALLRELPARLADYLAAPADEDICAALAGLLADAAWPQPLTNVAAVAWQRALASVEVREDAVKTLARQLRAVDEDVSLDVSGDVAAELVDGLLQELPVQVGAFSAAISRIGGGAGTLKDAEQAMRAAHTLKGAANTVGVSGIANLTHHLEDILVALIDAEKMPQRPLADALINAADCLEAMSEFLLALGPAPEHAVEALQEVLDYANRIDREGVAALATEVVAPSPTASAAMMEPRLAGERGSERSAPEHSLRVPAPVVDELLRLAGETLISNSQIQEHLKQAIDRASIIRRQHQLLQQLVAELEDLVDIRGIRSPRVDAVRNGTGFDALEFEHYSELQTISRRLIEASTDAQELAGAAEGQLSALDELLEEQRRLQMANQHAVMRTRMVTVSSVASRLHRGVRQTGRLLDKPVELSIQGENTSIDSHVLNDLMDPLMHLLRNAVDHGIEAAPERAAAGKPPHGRIELSFAREGNMIVVRCTDDGAGLDYSAIRRIAERKGMLRPEHEHSEDELARLILAPGFSTRDETSQVSGRGVGMDIVYSRVQEMKGMLALNSRRGQGLTVELRLPATLLAAHTLIVRQRERRLAISSRGIEDIRYAGREQIITLGERQFFLDGEQMHRLLKLEELLPMPHDRRALDREGFPVLLTRLHDGSVCAVLVQEILDSREVVMKKLGRYVPRTQGVIGAVILGDGGMAPVIDLVDLLQAPQQRQGALQREEQVSVAERSVPRAMPRALVVDDSLSARRAMAQVMKDAGYEVRTANDGLDAVNILGKFVPDIILSDMEMPRMNGLELTANVRHAEHTKHVPVIMITSRSTEKHRQMSTAAGVDVHLVKPFSDEALLQHVSRLTAR